MTEPDIDGKLSAFIQREDISPQMCDADAVFIVKIKCGKKQSLFRFRFNDELLFPINRDHTVGTAKNVGSDPKFESWPGEHSRRYRTTKGFGPAERRRIIHASPKSQLPPLLWSVAVPPHGTLLKH